MQHRGSRVLHHVQWLDDSIMFFACVFTTMDELNVLELNVWSWMGMLGGNDPLGLACYGVRCSVFATLDPGGLLPWL